VLSDHTNATSLLCQGTAVVLALCAAGHLAVAQDDPLLEASRDLTQRFGQQLQAALQDAMSEGGPVAAITVCKDEAPRIASELSRESGAKVSRTSERFRNPANAPEPWQALILAEFEASASESDGIIEYFSRTDGTVRYMQGIRLGPVSLACHGASIPDDVRRELEAEYPHDRARGYEIGELRGAFSISWPESPL